MIGTMPSRITARNKGFLAVEVPDRACPSTPARAAASSRRVAENPFDKQRQGRRRQFLRASLLATAHRRFLLNSIGQSPIPLCHPGCPPRPVSDPKPAPHPSPKTRTASPRDCATTRRRRRHGWTVTPAPQLITDWSVIYKKQSGMARRKTRRDQRTSVRVVRHAHRAKPGAPARR